MRVFRRILIFGESFERGVSRARVSRRREFSAEYERLIRRCNHKTGRGEWRGNDRKISAPPREIRVDKLDRRNSSEWNILSISRQWSVGCLARQPTFYCIAMRTPFLVSGDFCGRECKEDVRGRRDPLLPLFPYSCSPFCSSTDLYRVHNLSLGWTQFSQINNAFNFLRDHVTQYSRSFIFLLSFVFTLLFFT